MQVSKIIVLRYFFDFKNAFAFFFDNAPSLFFQLWTWIILARKHFTFRLIYKHLTFLNRVKNKWWKSPVPVGFEHLPFILVTQCSTTWDIILGHQMSIKLSVGNLYVVLYWVYIISSVFLGLQRFESAKPNPGLFNEAPPLAFWDRVWLG